MMEVDVIVIADNGDAHGDAVLSELATLGVRTLRYNLGDVRSTPIRVEQGAVDLHAAGEWHRVTSTTTVWWHRAGTVDSAELDEEESRLALDEGPHLLLGALKSVGVRWVDDPFDVERAELKLYQLGVAASLGILTPPTCVTNDSAAANKFAGARALVAKPLSPGRGLAPFVDEVMTSDLNLVTSLPTVLQELVEAQADLRVVVIGNDVWVWRRGRGKTTIDWRAQDPNGAHFHQVANDVIASASVQLNSALRLSMSVQDWLETKGGPVFLEVNPQGAWLFLEAAQTLVAPAVARHLTRSSPETDGVWPRAIKRFFWDFLPAKKAPADDGVEAPEFSFPTWAHAAAARPEAVDVARRAHDEAKSGAKVAEDKANRLVQVALALLTITLAVGAFLVQFAMDRSPSWLLSLGPIVAALVCLSLAAFEALEVDRVGRYHHPTAADLTERGVGEARAVLIAEEELGRRLAGWTSTRKHTDLMQARAWFSRGLAALIVAALVAAVGRAATSDPNSMPAKKTRTIATTTPPPLAIVVVPSASPARTTAAPGGGVARPALSMTSPTMS